MKNSIKTSHGLMIKPLGPVFKSDKSQQELPPAIMSLLFNRKKQWVQWISKTKESTTLLINQLVSSSRRWSINSVTSGNNIQIILQLQFIYFTEDIRIGFVGESFTTDAVKHMTAQTGKLHFSTSLANKNFTKMSSSRITQ